MSSQRDSHPMGNNPMVPIKILFKVKPVNKNTFPIEKLPEVSYNYPNSTYIIGGPGKRKKLERTSVRSKL